MQTNNKGTYLVLHNIRSAYNVGSIFRTADAAGVEKIYLTGYSPKPVDRFGRPESQIVKTALGAEKSVAWKYTKNLNEALKEIKNEGFEIVAVEQAPEAKNYKTHKRANKTAYVFGNEVRGLSPALLKKCDKIIEIPMKGEKESLNVAVAAGIILFS